MEKQNILATEKISKLIGKYAIPCVISLVVSALYNIVDQIFIGQYVGYVGNAATNVALPIVVIACAFAFMIGDGAAAYLSLKMGSGEKEKAVKGIENSVVSLIVIGILFTIFGLIFKAPLLTLFGASGEVYDFADQYMSVIIVGLSVYVFSSGINSVIRADGSPKYAMISMLVGAISNIGLDALFVPKMGVMGAAIATVIAQIISFIASIMYLYKMKSVKINLKNLNIDFKILKKVCSYGVSSFITQIAITIVIVLMNNSLSYYGEQSVYGSAIALAALGIVMKVNQILTSIVVGIAVGAQPILGYNYGAKNYKRVKETLITAMKIAIIVTFIGLLIFELCPQMLVNIFGAEDELYNEFSVKCFRIFLMLCVCTGFQITSGIFFQAIGKPVKSTILSLSRQILFFVPIILIAPRIWGINGVLYTGPISDGLAFIVSFTLIALELKSLNKKILKEEENVVGETEDTLDVQSEVKETESNKTIITIGREFGSAGRQIAKTVAKELGYKFYDKELIMLAAKKSGIDEELFHEVDEKVVDSFWYTLSMGAYSYQDSVNSLTDSPSNENLFKIQSDVIRDLAKKENCVIVGRCSDYILKDKAINIFLCADMDARISRIKEIYKLNDKKAKNLIENADKKRKQYYNYYTNQNWSEANNYDLVVNTTKVGIDETVKLIEEYVKSR